MQLFGDTIRFGIHAGQQNASYEDFVALWQRAEELGFDWVSDFDHFLPIYSDPSGPCFEGPTLLAAMAAQTERVRCGMLVTGVTYRHPAVLANIVATLDHISGGRIEYGLGAAWYALEHEQYGIPFPPIGERMDMLDETCRILRSMWTQETTTFAGRHFQLEDARCEPKPRQQHLPLVIGGSGERRTLRIVAEHADVWNSFLGDPNEHERLLGVLDRHCADVGRDPGDIRRSLTFRAILRDDEAQAHALAAPFLERAGTNPRMRQMLIVGTPQEAIERLNAFKALGGGDFLLGAMAPVDWETIELVATRVAPVVRG
jgi:F420-dependent oxidoreductase-like protein